MLTVKNIVDEDEISHWLRWIFELNPNSQKRAFALEIFSEALSTAYKGETDKCYYLVSENGKDQLLVKLNWSGGPNTINIAGFIRIENGTYASVCLEALIHNIMPECRVQKKKKICARSISKEGRAALLRLWKEGDSYDGRNSFCFHLT
jgi:hypothetical protein